MLLIQQKMKILVECLMMIELALKVKLNKILQYFNLLKSDLYEANDYNIYYLFSQKLF